MEDNIIERLKRKDENAFNEIYKTYNKLVYYVIFKIVKDEEITKDLVQETFLTVYNKIDQYSGVGNFKYWLLQTAKNKAKNQLKKMSRENKIFILDEEMLDSIIDERLDINDFSLKIKKYIDDVSVDIIIARIFFDYTFDEIAKSMNMNINDVYHKYRVAIDKLKDHIEIK